MTPEQQNTVFQVKQCVIERLGQQQAGHGMDHIERVVRAAQEIHAEVGGDRYIVELAAWLHDVGDAKFCNGVERSGELSIEILSSLAVPQAIIEHVVSIVDNISFRKGVDPALLTLEGKIVQDADRLDALGAIGIVRTIEYGASVSQPFFAPGQDPFESKSGIGHFYQKLFKLSGLLNTAPAKRIAHQREQFMRQFVQQYFAECGIERLV